MITKIFAIFIKEWRLLCRDKVGLIFLFILPMCLVLFITLSSSVNDDKPRTIKLALINYDHQGQVSQALVKGLKKLDNFAISETNSDHYFDETSAQQAVSKGDYQALIVIPTHLSQSFINKMQPAASSQNKLPAIKIFFDPALPKNFQDQIKSAMQILLRTIELQFWQQLAHQLVARSSQASVPENNQPILIEVTTDHIKTGSASTTAPAANDVQQNVPAWALFGMFFIITPLSGMIVKERCLGVMSRLRLAPVPLWAAIWGKIAAFICVNLLQLALMLAVGVFILPWFDLPSLDVTQRPGAIAILGLVSSLAATGFGLLIGSMVKTPEQANVIGPFLIVILAAIGGIFIPIYLLPEAFKHMAAFSPMYWALQSFIDIFVRNAGIQELLPNIIKLLSFGLVTIGAASLILSRHQR